MQAAMGSMLLLSVLSASGDWGDYSVSILWAEFRPSQLQMMVRSYRHLRSLPDGPRMVDHDRSYLILGNLDDDGVLTGTPKLVGPVWEVKKAHSGAALSIGAAFTNADRKMLEQRPTIRSLADGTIDRLRESNVSGVYLRDRLVLQNGKASWKAEDNFQRIPVERLGKFVRSTDGACVVGSLADGEVGIFHTESGAKFTDDWLARSFEECLALKNGHLTDVKLTADLAHLVFCDNSGHFDFQGHRHNCSRYGVSFDRPDQKGKIFEKDAEVRSVFSMNGKVILSSFDDTRYYLSDLQHKRFAETVFSVTPPPRIWWDANNLWHDKVIVYFDDLFRKRTFGWVAWDIRRNGVTESGFNFGDLFHLVEGEHVPVHVVPVAEVNE